MWSTSSKLARFSWALYDLANTVFSMNIISFYFVLWLTIDKGCGEVYYSLALGGSIFLAAILMPVLGEISDKLKRKMPFFMGFSLVCVFFTALLGFVNKIIPALLLFAIANFCYQLAGVFYNALLAQVSTRQGLGRTSGLGVSLGYLGTILGLVLVKPFFDASGLQATFFPTAMLFLLFAFPAFVFIKDPPYPRIPKLELKITSSFLRVIKQLRHIRHDPVLIKFFISIFLCFNGLNTIIVFMSVYAKRVMNFAIPEMMYFMVVSAIVAIIGAYAFGHVTDLLGSKRTFKLVIKLWCLVIFMAGICVSRWAFWIIGPLAGICFGGTWVSARTMLVELVPEEKMAQMFGIFGLIGTLAIFGPIVWGIITTWLFTASGNLKYRVAIASVLIFMLCGYFVFKDVADNVKGHKLKLEN